jgi:oxygen-independent coproporphyrinogen-3 oxidase
MRGTVTEQAKGEGPEPLGLYLHVPFCASTCDFCAFYQVTPTVGTVEGFIAGVGDEAQLVHWDRPIATMFWGGGTPGMLSPGQLEALAAQVRVPAAADCEWTVELAPASVTEDRLRVLRDLGVTRISLGVQSFRPDLLAALGRQHSPAQVYRAYERIRARGFASVNLDLMFALPGQDESTWEAEVAEAVALAPDHLSTYCLTFEEDTALWVKLSQGRVKLDPEREARMYESTWDRLGAEGYAQYEVSNFARPGHACRHNLNTWRMHEWVGLGPSAASQYGGWRGANEADLAAWQLRVGSGGRMAEDRVRLSPALLAEDAVVFGLRLNAGVDLAPWQERCPDVPWGAVAERIDRLIESGLASREAARVRLTNRGRLLADSVGVELMGAFEP